VKTKFPICSKQVEKKINKMTDTSPYLSLITLNVNVPNSPIKTEVLRKKKKDPTMCCLQESHFNSKSPQD
jgi:hypothetical protein